MVRYDKEHGVSLVEEFGWHSLPSWRGGIATACRDIY